MSIVGVGGPPFELWQLGVGGAPFELCQLWGWEVPLLSYVDCGGGRCPFELCRDFIIVLM